jgi:hypothetical protein
LAWELTGSAKQSGFYGGDVKTTDKLADGDPTGRLGRKLTNLGLVDEYRLYLRPVVLGRGKPFFAGPRPLLRLVTSNRITEDLIRLT